MRSRVVFVVFAVMCASAQQTGTPPSPPASNAPAANAPTESINTQNAIKVQVNEVIVPVTVTDEKGRFVSDLDKKDFRIFDQGKEQTIEYFSRERNQPVVVGFLMDMSNASRLYWKTYQEATIDLVLTLLPGDKKYSGYLISYGNDAELQVNTTSDPEAINSKLRKLKPGGGSSLYDAIYMACTNRKLVKGEPVEPRRVLVIVGDGHDNASKKTLDQAIEVAQRNLVTVYAVSTVAFGFVTPDERNLVRIAEETGGRVEAPLQKVYSDVSGYLSTPQDAGNYSLPVGTGAYSSEIANGMFKAIANVAGEITTQYILRYIPDVPEEKRVFRNVKVEVALPAVKVRARKGYYPFAPGGGLEGLEQGR